MFLYEDETQTVRHQRNVINHIYILITRIPLHKSIMLVG